MKARRIAGVTVFLACGAMLLSLSAFVVGFPRRTPPVLRGLECDPAPFGNCIQINAAFDHMIQQRYPLGSDAAAMIQDLRDMGFSYSGPRGFTHCETGSTKVGELVKRPFVPCPFRDNHWNPQNQVAFAFHPFSLFDCTAAMVTWSANQSGKLTYIEGVRTGPDCGWP